MLSYAQNKIISWNEARKTEDYALSQMGRGYAFGQLFGYKVDNSNGNGFFNSQQEIDNSNLAYSFGTPRPGDLRYRDLNADGKIDERDKAPVGTGVLPKVIYGISGGLTYKNFDLSLLFRELGNTRQCTVVQVCGKPIMTACSASSIAMHGLPTDMRQERRSPRRHYRWPRRSTMRQVTITSMIALTSG